MQPTARPTTSNQMRPASEGGWSGRSAIIAWQEQRHSSPTRLHTQTHWMQRT